MSCEKLSARIIQKTGNCGNVKTRLNDQTLPMLFLRYACLMCLLTWAVTLPSALAQITLRPHDTVLFYGNSLVERLGEHGELEAMVHLALPDHQLHFRSLAWTGDEVGYRLRPEGYEEHLKSLLAQWLANVVIVGFGLNESFAGEAGLGDFRTQLDTYLNQLARLHPGAQFALLTPTAVEPEASERNRALLAYAQTIAQAAATRGALLIDLFAASQNAYANRPGALTWNGLYLNAAGNRELARTIAAALLSKSAIDRLDPARVTEVAKAVTQKAYYVAEVVRPKNADLYYGVRKRPEENAAEIPRYHQMIAATEGIIYEMVRQPGKKFADFPTPWLAALPPGAGHDDGPNTGIIKTPTEQQAEFRVAPGYSVNLFASEVEFPELKNPVQIAFDARGRLWVVTMPSFPHTVPGLPPQDKLLVLEDTDQDGKADRCTTFAEGLDAFDGVAFSEAGVIVSEQPKLWLMTDTDGDGRADTRQELLRGIDVTDSHHGGMIATDPMGMVWFCDGVFHRSQIETPFGVVRGIDATTYHLNPRTGRVETEWQSITPNPWKITYDRTGNYFQMYGDGLVLDALPLTWTPLGVYHPFAYAKTVDYGKGSAAASISSPNFPDEYQQGMASAALLGRYVVSLTKYRFDEGMVRGSGRLDLLTSTNAAFRPADVAFGFDGALYVSDFCSSIIGHAQHPMRDPHWDHDHGRIWRVVNHQKSVVKSFPRIEGASVPELLALLTHSQDLIRHHVRIELRKHGPAVLPALDRWIAEMPRTAIDFSQSALEALFVAEGLGQTRPLLLSELAHSASPLHRAAAARLVRFQADRLTDATERLHQLAGDSHPRVQMEVVGAVAHLRPRFPAVEHVVHSVTSTNADVQQMLADLRYGTQPAKGRSVPVLEVAPETRLRHWWWLGERGQALPRLYSVTNNNLSRPSTTRAPGGVGLYRTWVEADRAQPAVLAVRHGFLDISVNGIQLLSSDSMWSNDQQVQLELRKGLNSLELEFRNLRGTPPAVFLYDPLGQALVGARTATDEATLREFTDRFAIREAAQGIALHVQAVPNKMQFSPKELRVKVGTPVRLIFENPDLMLHNLLILEAGAEEEVGTLADQLAAQADGLAKGYVPTSNKVLHATGLVQPKHRTELNFKAPITPGNYPFICTFPGHRRLMRGVLVVE